MTTEKPGADLRADDPEARRAAAAMLGSARTPAKIEAARQNALAAAEARKGAGTSAAQKEAVKAYWEQYRANKAATAEQEREPKRPVGRPPKPKPETAEPKRPVGRPKKVAPTE
jgi:hypothetical protein